MTTRLWSVGSLCRDLSAALPDARIVWCLVQTRQAVDVPPLRGARSEGPAWRALDGELGREVEHDPVALVGIGARSVHDHKATSGVSCPWHSVPVRPLSALKLGLLIALGSCGSVSPNSSGTGGTAPIGGMTGTGGSSSGAAGASGAAGTPSPGTGGAGGAAAGAAGAAMGACSGLCTNVVVLNGPITDQLNTTSGACYQTNAFT